MLFWNCDMGPLKQRCTGHGICSFTGEEHIVLAFENRRGNAPLTEKAQVYPPALRNALAQQYCAAYHAGRCEKVFA